MEDAATDTTDTGTSAGMGAEATQVDATPTAEPASAGADSNAAKDAPAQGGEAEKPAEEQKANEWLGVPEHGYNQDGIDVPEGMELDDDTCEALAGACKDLGLSQKSFATIINKVGPALQAQEAKAIDEFRSNNLKQFAADKELGGAKAKESIRLATTAYEKYCSPALKELFKETGLNTHPDMIKMFYGLAQAISEDTTPRGNGGSHGYDVRQFFKNSNMN